MGLAVGQAPQQSLTDQWYAWAYGVLSGIGAPTSQTNINTLWNWSIKESGSTPIRNGSIQNNPLNTTQSAPGSKSVNSVGVQTFPDVSTGVGATSQTLLNGRYPDIVQALRNSVPAPQWASNPAIVSQLNTWGSHSNWLSWNNTPPTPSANFQSATGGATAFGAASQGNPVSDALNAALGPVGDAIMGAEQNFVTKAGQIALMVAGGLLMVGGIAILVFAAAGKAAPTVGRVVANTTPQGRAVTVGAATPKPAGKPAARSFNRQRLADYGASEDLETRQDGKPTGKLRPSVREKIRRGE